MTYHIQECSDGTPHFGCPGCEEEYDTMHAELRQARAMLSGGMTEVDIERKKAGEKRRAEALAMARSVLVKNAVQCTYYVAQGKCAAGDLVKEFGISQTEAEYALAVACKELVDKIQK